MLDLKLSISENEEMYLVSVALLEESGHPGPVPLSLLAHELAIQPVSANQMVRKLEESGLLAYTPYKGVALTPPGRQLALRLLRTRRLWEVFLVEHLQVPLTEARRLACRLEHLLPDETISRLSAFLGNPPASPDGKPIPPPDGSAAPPSAFPLSQLLVGAHAEVISFDVIEPARLFLADSGLHAGVPLTILGISPSGALLLEVAGQPICLAGSLAARIWVNPIVT